MIGLSNNFTQNSIYTKKLKYLAKSIAIILNTTYPFITHIQLK